MVKSRIALAMLSSMLLSCSDDRGRQDADDNARDVADAVDSPGLVLPAFEVLPAPDGPHCACQGPSSQTPGGPETVVCELSPTYCGECPVPFSAATSSLCATLGLRCDYPETWCTCVARDGGLSVWECVASP